MDLSHVSILYTQGDMAAITPIYDYNFQASLSSDHCSHTLFPCLFLCGLWCQHWRYALIAWEQISALY